MLSTGVLESFVQSTVADSDLSAQIGDELAMLIAEAEVVRDDGIQHVVVRSSPVHLINSLMEEEAELFGHEDVMCSCLAIVNKLRQKGQITAVEEKKAIAYLQLHDKPWPHEPDISYGATLYLDDMSINNFLHLGLLGKLQNAGFRAVVSPSKKMEAIELVSFESISGKVVELIDQIRLALRYRIQTGRIKLGRRRNEYDLKKQPIQEHPTIEVISLATNCDAIISDDRYLNQHENMEVGSRQALIISTLDVLDLLIEKELITSDEKMDFITLLRQSGYRFVPLTIEELTNHLASASIIDSKVIETAELKAIRENILCVRMSNWLQIPKEAHWLNETFQIFNRVLKSQWRVEADISSSIAYSNWILDQFDISGWTHLFGEHDIDRLDLNRRGTVVIQLLTLPSDAQHDLKEAYWSWVEDRLLLPIKEQHPELYVWLVGWQKSMIYDMAANMKLTEVKNNIDLPYRMATIALAALKLVSPMIQKSLFEDAKFCNDFGLSLDAILHFHGTDVSFQRSELYGAVRSIYSNSLEVNITDTGDNNWKLALQNKVGESPSFAISREKQHLNIPNFAEFSQDSNVRLGSFNKLVFEANLPIIERDKWQRILTERAFQDDEFDEFNNDVHNTPFYRARLINDEIKNGQRRISSLVPPSRSYFERLVGVYNGSSSIKEYANDIARKHFNQLAMWSAYDGLMFSLYSSLHFELTDKIVVSHINNEDLIHAFEFLESKGDRISQLGGIEIGMRILPKRPEIEPLIISLIKQIRDDEITDTGSGFKLLSALFVLVDGELSRIRLFPTEPPFYRRLASLTQAALIHRQVVNSGIDIESFCDWALRTRAKQYYFQTLVDMRVEPRWSSEFASASQMKAEFFGRILNAAKHYEENIINEGELHDLVFSIKHGSIQSLVKSHHLYYPGPLEGVDGNTLLLPSDFSEVIEMQLTEEKVGPSSFITLVNSASLYRVETHHTELAIQALKLGNYRLANLKGKDELLLTLNGLATVAPAARSSSLVNELQILVRRYLNDPQYSLSIQEALMIYLVAAASKSDMNEWVEYVGDGLTELAFGKFDEEEGKMLYSHLQFLCQIVPQLWVTCGRAEAALKAYNESWNYL
jgi:hypothetical protein